MNVRVRIIPGPSTEQGGKAVFAPVLRIIKRRWRKVVSVRFATDVALMPGLQHPKEPALQTPDIFEQIAHGMGNPKKISQWVRGNWPGAADGKAVASQTKAWIGSVESLLNGAEALRHLQLDAIHTTQKRTSRLARSLDEAQSPAETVMALQVFEQENIRDALQYWSVYREIVRDAESQMLTGNTADDAHDRSRSSVRHSKSVHAAQGKSPRAA